MIGKLNIGERWLIEKINWNMDTYQVESCICGYHIYKDNWNPFINEELDCVCEILNPMDVYAVAVVCTGITVGHIP